MSSWVDFLHLLSCTLILILIEFVGSQPLTNCSLDFSFPGQSDSGGGDWGGFLSSNCSDLGFDKYLYGLGLRAKQQTGKIYLNSTEQSDCLISMKSLQLQGDVMSCGIERLSSGAAGCSDYSVADVSNNLGSRLADFKESCQFTGPDSCGSCVGSWRDIRATTSTSEDSGNDQDDVCRFAVLVSLTSSRIDDQGYAKSLYACLGEQASRTDEANRAKDEKRKPKVTWILIGCLGGFAGIIVIVAFIYGRKCFFRQKKQPPNRHALNSVVVKERCCRKISTREVYAATNNFHALNLIGQGTAGKVYKGVLRNKQHVAIKHIVNDEDEGEVETFAREVTSLSHIRHPNLVTLLGCCVKQDECFLVYELCPNGNLSQWIFGKDKVLSWIQRLEIAIGSARGLCFLHTYPQGCIVHRDIKPTNILLAANFEAKLSDFGLSKVIEQGETYAISEVRGSFGYVDPEYQNNNHVKSSGDVYSFGIVLLQILSGKKVINLNVKTPIRLNKMAKALTREGSTAGFADPKLQGEYPTEAFELTLELALSCTALKQQRPSMGQVVATLEEALALSITTPSMKDSTAGSQFD